MALPRSGECADIEDRRRHKQNSSSGEEISGFSTDDRANGRSQQNATDGKGLDAGIEARVAGHLRWQAGRLRGWQKGQLDRNE